jgi:flagellar basal body-associated protein FliL
MLSLLILAQDRGEQQVPDPGSGIPIILVVLALIVIGAVVLWAIFVRGAKRSKGGVQPPPEETGQAHPSAPPLESVEPRS